MFSQVKNKLIMLMTGCLVRHLRVAPIDAQDNFDISHMTTGLVSTRMIDFPITTSLINDESSLQESLKA